MYRHPSIVTLPPGATLPPVASQLPPGSASDGTLLGRRLVWRQGDLTLRIESSLGQEAPIALAETFRTGG